MPLVPLASVDRSVLRWLRSPGAPEEFTLSSGDQPVMVLRWPPHRGGAVQFTTAGAAWWIDRRGFLNPHLLLRPAEQGPVLARAAHHSIEVPGESPYSFRRMPGLEIPSWQVTTSGGSELIHLEPVREGRRLEGGAVLVTPAGQALADLTVLLGLTWCFVAYSWFEDEALIPLEDLNESPNNPDLD